MNQPINVDINKTLPIKCKCGNETFVLEFFLRRIPGILIMQLQDVLHPVSVYRCTRCKNLFDFGKYAKEAAEKLHINPKNPQ